MQLRHIDIAFPAERSARAWEAQYAEGQVPDRWPYGLDRLGGHVDSLAAVEWRIPTRAGVVRRVLSRRHVRGSLDRALLCWDEGTAARLAQLPFEGTRLYAGVIWATDAVAQRESRLKMRAMRSLLRDFDGLWCLSSAQVEPLREWLGIEADRVGLIDFGVDSEFFDYKDYTESNVVLSLGNDKDRDYETLLRAAEQVADRRPQAKIILQGRHLQNASTRRNIQILDRVSHLAVKQMYEKAAVVAVATRENLHASGMTVCLEAMASGRPVVMTRTPGIENYVRDGEVGRLSGSSDADAMAEAIIFYLDNPVIAAQHGRSGREQIAQSNNTEKMAESLVRFMQSAGGASA